MTSQALRPIPRRLRRRPPLAGLGHRRRRRPALDDAELLSVAGAVGSTVTSCAGERLGTLDDLLVRWDAGEQHPPLYGAVIRRHHRRTFAPASAIAALRPGEIVVDEAPSALPDERAPWLVALAHDVLDRQIVDVDGADVVRVSDLVLAHRADGFRLVGVDVSARTLMRRLGPAPLRRWVALERVYDWGSVAAFSIRGPGEAGSALKLTDAATRLHKLSPSELDALLDDLPGHERRQLSARVATEAGT
jgi:hypothetical protein